MILSDEKLIQSFISGDETAFSALVERYKHPVFQFILMKVKNRETASDLTQDVFVRLFHAAGRYTETGKFFSWLIRIAQNICIDYYRKNQGKKIIALPEESEGTDSQLNLQLSDQKIGVLNLAEELEKSEIQIILKNAIDQLPEEQREVMILCHYQGLTYRDISEIQNCPLGTVKSRIHHAHLKIKDYLERAGIDFI